MLKLAIVLVVGWATISAMGAPVTYYVDIARAGEFVQTGSSWATAFGSLQAALAASGDGDAFLVREGTYTPGTTAAATFVIDNRLLYGGFDSNDNSANGPEDADPAVNITILSGDLPGTVFAEHVVTIGATATLDGFLIKAGRTLGSTAGPDRGGGIYLTGGNVTIHECVITSNQAKRGAGIYISGGSPTIENCVISSNEANATDGRGGGAWVVSTDADFINCTFQFNQASAGGGLAIEGLAAMGTVAGCTFDHNDATQEGGGLYVLDASPTITFIEGTPKDATIFEANTAPAGGGASVALSNADRSDPLGPHFESCQFLGNIAMGDAGGNGGGAALVSNLLAADRGLDDVEFTDCNFSGNRISFQKPEYCVLTGIGAGLFISGSPEITDCIFQYNGPWGGKDWEEILINGGGVAINNYNIPGAYVHTATFSGCKFRRNTHVMDGVIQRPEVRDPPQSCDDPELVEVPHTDFITHGGGVYIQRSAFNPVINPFPEDWPATAPTLDAVFTNCDFIENVSGNGGGVFLDRAAATFTDCRFTENNADGNNAHTCSGPPGNECNDPLTYRRVSAGYGGGAISTYRLSYVVAVDCIFAHNTTSASEFNPPEESDNSISGGAVYVYEGTTFIADRCYFVGNSATNTQAGYGNGGALWVHSKCVGLTGGCGAGWDFLPGEEGGEVEYYAKAQVYNCLLVGNEAQGNGGAVYNQEGGVIELVNCTIMHNKAGDRTGGVYADSLPTTPMPDPCATELYNCIVHDNEDGVWVARDLRQEVYERRNSTLPWPTVEASCIESGAADTPVLTVFVGADNNIGDADALAEAPDVPDTNSGSGTWDSAVYNPVTGRTTFTDSGATVTGWTNKILFTRSAGTDPQYSLRSIIVEVHESTDKIEVLGDLTLANVNYTVEHYLIPTISPCHDEGVQSHLPSAFNAEDILGLERLVNDIDMGCYENQDE